MHRNDGAILRQSVPSGRDPGAANLLGGWQSVPAMGTPITPRCARSLRNDRSAVPGKRDNGSRRLPGCKKAGVQCGRISTGWDCNTAKSHPFPPKRIPRSRRPFSPSRGNRFSRKPKRACATYSSWAPFWLFVVSDADFCPPRRDANALTS